MHLDHIIGFPFFVALSQKVRSVETFSLGSVVVDIMDSTHPQGSTIYRLTRAGKSLVYATDFEHTPEKGFKALDEFARVCDLLIYDAQYKEEEYEKYRGYSHSTPEAGLKIADEAGAAKVLFVHHSPGQSDAELLQMEREIFAAHGSISFAKIGNEILI